jgi:hypothetical protein
MRPTQVPRLISGAVIAGIVITVGIGSPSVAASHEHLRGLTVVTGSVSATSTVILDRPATVVLLPGLRSDAIKVTGGGRYAGIMLTRRSGGPVTSLEAVNVNFCNVPGCQPLAAQQYVDSNAPRVARVDGSQTVTLGVGSYDLQLVADRAPVTVTLTLSGLPGSTHLRPRGPSAAAILDMTPTAGVSTGPVYSAGTTRSLAFGGSVVTALVADRQASAGRQSGLCVYRGSPPTAGVYTEQCPGAYFGAQLLIPEVAVADTVHEYGGVLGLPTAQWSVGQYEITVGSADVRIANGLWLQP